MSAVCHPPPEPGSALERQCLPRSWGIGWAWDDSAQRYFAYASDYYTHLPNVKQVMEHEAQRAVCHQVIKTVSEYGMMVESETVTPGGEIQVVVRTF